MTPNNRCIFAVERDGESWCELASGLAQCNGDNKDKQRCPFWAIVDAMSRIETSIQMLEVRE